MSFESAQIMCTHLIECWQWPWLCGCQIQTASASRDWHPLRHCWELFAERLVTSSQQQIPKQWEYLNRQLALDGIFHGCVQVQPWDLVKPLLRRGLSVMSAWVSQAACGTSYHLPAMVNKDSPTAQPAPLFQRQIFAMLLSFNFHFHYSFML